MRNAERTDRRNCGLWTCPGVAGAEAGLWHWAFVIRAFSMAIGAWSLVIRRPDCGLNGPRGVFRWKAGARPGLFAPKHPLHIGPPPQPIVVRRPPIGTRFRTRRLVRRGRTKRLWHEHLLPQPVGAPPASAQSDLLPDPRPPRAPISRGWRSWRSWRSWRPWHS